MQRLVLVLGLGLGGGILSAPHALAADPQVNWSWSFDRTEHSVRYDESVVLRATLFNEATSTGNLVVGNVGSIFSGDLQKAYDFQTGLPGLDLGQQLLGSTVAPGASLPFVFGVLSPIPGAVLPGSYDADPAFLAIDSVELLAANTFRINVAVPEPSTSALLVVGGLVLGRRRRG